MAPPSESTTEVDRPHAYSRVVASPLRDWSVLGAMLAIWHLRPALQRSYPLHKMRPRDWMRFLAWCATDGRKDYAILREIPELTQELNRPVSLPLLKNDAWKNCFSLGMFFSGVATYRWSFSALLSTKKARNRAARAFWRGRRHEIGMSEIPEWQKVALEGRFDCLPNFIRVIRLGKHDATLTDDELIEKCGLKDLEFGRPKPAGPLAVPAFVTLPAGLHVSPVPIPLRVMRVVAPIMRCWGKNPTESERASVVGRIPARPSCISLSSHRIGVNLFGYAHGELGIGEDIRQVASALQSQGVPVCIINFKPGSNISQADRSVDSLIVTEPQYGINVFCMTGIETTRYACEMGLRALEGRYNIGLWPWELPDWPESCRHAYACVDEVWGISQYTAHAHRHAAPRPVLPMGLPVELGPLGAQTRKDFGLPSEAYLFYFAFDINSNAARKNPEGLIKAFQMAFPKEGKDQVGLVLKISHPETGCRLWKRIRKIARRDKRIHVIEKTMRRPELLALFKTCDCLVSLHRAEGFGRCIAEALLLDKQVITTGFSGNLDFCHEPRVALVRHTMRKVEAKDYMWGEGQMWAEPDLDHAAELMRSIWKEPREVGAGNCDFSLESVGQRYKSRLEEIWHQYAAKPLEEALEHRISNIEY
jgi:hypothetical protein